MKTRIESATCFRDFFKIDDKNYSPLKSRVDEIWRYAEKHFLNVQCGNNNTDQSIQHCLRVEKNLYRLIKECEKLYQKWDELDFFYLSVAACLHDLGKIPSDRQKSEEYDHGKGSCEIICEQFDRHLDWNEIVIVSQIIEYHSTKNREILENIDEKKSPNIQRLAVLFLLGDVLDTTTERALRSREIQDQNYGKDVVYTSRKVITSWEIVNNGYYDKINLNATVNSQNEYDMVVDYVNNINRKDLFPAYPYLITYDLPTKLILNITPLNIHQKKIKTSNQVQSISIGDIEKLRNEYNTKMKKKFKEYRITNLNSNEKIIIDKILTNESPKKILVVGDIMLDHSMTCYPAPFDSCTIHNIDEDYSFCIPRVKPVEDKKLGGAANIAYCCREFSNVVLFGVTGKDTCGDELLNVATESCITPKLKKIDNFVTTVKIYYHIKEDGKKDKTIRINFELDEEAGKEAISNFIDGLEYEFRSLLNDKDIECVIFKDHQKGFLSAKFLKEISYYINARLYNDKKFFVIVDPKYDWEKFLVFDEIRAITPNIKEATAGVYPLYIQEKDERETAITKRMKNSKLEYEDWIYLSEKYKNIRCFIVKADEKGASILTPMNSKIISVDRYKEKERKEDPSEIGCGDLFASYYVQCLMIQNSLENNLSNEKSSDDNLEGIFLYLANAAAGLKLNLEKSKKLKPETVRVSLGTYRGMY